MVYDSAARAVLSGYSGGSADENFAGACSLLLLVGGFVCSDRVIAARGVWEYVWSCEHVLVFDSGELHRCARWGAAFARGYGLGHYDELFTGVQLIPGHVSGLLVGRLDLGSL